MKGQHYTTEDKIRILRERDRGKNILEVCREHNIKGGEFPALEAPVRADRSQRGV